MIATLLLAALLLVSTITDVLRHTIYNWTTYPGILLAWGLNALGSALVAMSVVDPEKLQSWGWIGIGESGLGFLVCGFVLLVCFVLFHVGGGDVKLIAMMGAFLGLEQGIIAMLWTFVLGACMGLILLMWRVGPVRLAASAARHLRWMLRLGQLNPLTPEERAMLQPPLFLAPSALGATLIVQCSLAEQVSVYLGG